MTPEVSSVITNIRQKMGQGLEVTLEEQIEAVRLLRADRMSAAIGSATKKAKGVAKAAASNVDGNDLLGEMMG